jgi:hypothetical protein
LSSSSSPRGGASRGAVGAPTSDSSCTRPLQQRTQSPRSLRRRRSRGRCCTIVDGESEGGTVTVRTVTCFRSNGWMDIINNTFGKKSRSREERKEKSRHRAINY